MKGWHGFIELILIMVFVVAGIPLLLTLIMVLNRSKFNYLDDKTIYSMTSTSDMYLASDGKYYPVNLVPVNTDFGGALCLSLVQDDYCPDEAKEVLWMYHCDDVTESKELMTDSLDYTTGNCCYELHIADGWFGRRQDAFVSQYNGTQSGGVSMSCNLQDQRKEYLSEGRLYLAYNNTEKAWMITMRKINTL